MIPEHAFFLEWQPAYVRHTMEESLRSGGAVGFAASGVKGNGRVRRAQALQAIVSSPFRCLAVSVGDNCGEKWG